MWPLVVFVIGIFLCINVGVKKRAIGQYIHKGRRLETASMLDIDLDDVYDSIQVAMQKFEDQGIRENDLIKIKAIQETSFYNGISSVLGKSFQLAQYNVFAGDPAFIEKDIENIKKVTKEDVLRVYNKYIKDKPYIMTSFVPKGQLNLITENSVKAEIVEEQIKEKVKSKTIL